MHRIFRPVLLASPALLAGMGLLLGAPAAHAADYILDGQAGIGGAGAGSTEQPAKDFDALTPAIAAAPEHHRALIVWSADDAGAVAGNDDDKLHVVDDEFEIFGRFVNTSTLDVESAVGRISVMGNDLESEKASRQDFDATNPSVAWNPVAEEFLIVWQGDDDTAPLVDDEFEIFGQRMNIDGEVVGERLRISIMGDDAATDAAQRQAFGAAHPVVTVNPTTGDYLVVWHGDSDSAPLVDNELEVFGRLLGVDGVATGPQIRISFAGSDGNATYDAIAPDVVFNPVSGSYVVAWQADGNAAGLVDGENEIFLQQVSASGAIVNAPVTVSTMGPASNAEFDAIAPTLAVNPSTGALLVAWHGDTDAGALVDNEMEIFARIFDMNAAPLGSQFRVSTMGSDSETDAAKRALFGAGDASAEWSESDQRFLVAWRGDTDMEIEAEDADGDPLHLVDDEFEIFGRFVTTDGAQPESQFRISVQGSDATEDAEAREAFGADQPAIKFANGVLLTAWSGDSSTDGSSNDQLQIFAARIAMNAVELSLAGDGSYEQPTVPDPIRVGMVLTNSGDITAEGVAVRVSMTTEFPYTLEGCESVVDDNTCILGDIPADGTANFAVILETDHLAIEDELGTDLSFSTVAETAIDNVSSSSPGFFVGAKLKLAGGSGSLGGFWLLLLALAPLATIARRRR
ncbi:MAG TPA: hypothetical protein VF275_01680 [Gammaproteobacteria bacterium]